jgi:uncharacterized protein (DUF3084 family)
LQNTELDAFKTANNYLETVFGPLSASEMEARRRLNDQIELNSKQTKLLQRLHERLDTLQAQNENLQANNDALKAENTKLKADNTKLKADNTKLKADITAIQAENKGLIAKCNTIQSDFDDFKAQVTKALEKNGLNI